MADLGYQGGARFMRPSEVIIRLIEARALVSNSESDYAIFGVGDFAKAVASKDFLGNAGRAAIYVMTGNSSSNLTSDAGHGNSVVNHTIDIVLSVAMKDNRGQRSDQISVWFKEFLVRALSGFSAYDGGQPLIYSGDQFIQMNNVAGYQRTYQFSQRVMIDGSDYLQEENFEDLDDFLTVCQTMTAEAPDLGETTPDTALDINLQS